MKSNIVIKIVLLMFFSGVFFTSFPVLSSQEAEKIIGQDDFVFVNAEATNIPFKFKKLVNAFGMFKFGCTATHIGGGYVLTAGHCFWGHEEISKNVDCSQNPENEIEWGVREGKGPYLVSKCEKIIIMQRNQKTDYALVKVSPVPPVAIAPELNQSIDVGTRITIFSHADALPLRWSQFCRVQKQFLGEFHKDLIHHKCDTNPGSSGATILDADSLKIVGIHDGGMAYDGLGINYGTYLMSTPLVQVLKQIGFK